MAGDWESTFKTWAQAPSQTERDKCANAERAIRNAIGSSKALADREISIFAQGSYRNRTNVRADSDVDICICCHDSFFFDLPDGLTAERLGISTPAKYGYAQFKDDVQQALEDHFKEASIQRGDKAFDVHENTYRIAADAVAAFEYRWYDENGGYATGTSFKPDSGGRIVNWPEQNYANGIEKNDRTGKSFKGVVRIMKTLRNAMADAGHESAEAMSSFLIECLIWNVPDEGFSHATWEGDVRYAIVYLYQATQQASTCKEWGEINELKYLFHSKQPWTREGVNGFLADAWHYLGFG